MRFRFVPLALSAFLLLPTCAPYPKSELDAVIATSTDEELLRLIHADGAWGSQYFTVYGHFCDLKGEGSDTWACRASYISEELVNARRKAHGGSPPLDWYPYDRIPAFQNRYQARLSMYRRADGLLGLDYDEFAKGGAFEKLSPEAQEQYLQRQVQAVTGVLPRAFSDLLLAFPDKLTPAVKKAPAAHVRTVFQTIPPDLLRTVLEAEAGTFGKRAIEHTNDPAMLELLMAAGSPPQRDAEGLVQAKRDAVERRKEQREREERQAEKDHEARLERERFEQEQRRAEDAAFARQRSEQEFREQQRAVEAYQAQQAAEGSATRRKSENRGVLKLLTSQELPPAPPPSKPEAPRQPRPPPKIPHPNATSGSSKPRGKPRDTPQ